MTYFERNTTDKNEEKVIDHIDLCLSISAMVVKLYIFQQNVVFVKTGFDLVHTSNQMGAVMHPRLPARPPLNTRRRRVVTMQRYYTKQLYSTDIDKHCVLSISLFFIVFIYI